MPPFWIQGLFGTVPSIIWPAAAVYLGAKPQSWSFWLKHQSWVRLTKSHKRSPEAGQGDSIPQVGVSKNIAIPRWEVKTNHCGTCKDCNSSSTNPLLWDGSCQRLVLTSPRMGGNCTKPSLHWCSEITLDTLDWSSEPTCKIKGTASI